MGLINRKIETINYKEELVVLAKRLGLRKDWHEPDEQGISAKAFGTCFDNAGFWGLQDEGEIINDEMFIVLYEDEIPVAEINLATLFAIACQNS